MKEATRELTDVISKNNVNANANTFKHFEVPAFVANAANEGSFELAA